MCRNLLLGISLGLFVATLAMAAEPQKNQKSSGSVAGDISQGIHRVESTFSETWADVKSDARRMTIKARVYTRLYWDKSLANATLDIESSRGGVIVLKGSVPSQAAKQRAADLAKTTIGVAKVVNNLAIAPAAAAKQ